MKTNDPFFPTFWLVTCIVLSALEVAAMIPNFIFLPAVVGPGVVWSVVFLLAPIFALFCKVRREKWNYVTVYFLVIVILRGIVVLSLLAMIVFWNAISVGTEFQAIANIILVIAIVFPAISFVFHLVSIILLLRWYAGSENEEGDFDPSASQEGTNASIDASFEAHTWPLLEFRV